MFMQHDTAFATADVIDLAALISAPAPAPSGLLAGTRVEAAGGWRPVESLMRGDAVYTLDGGLRQVEAIHRRNIAPRRALCVPGGALGNCAEMWVMPDQLLGLETPLAARAFGTPFVLVPAEALAGFRGIAWVETEARMELVTLVFQDEEIVWANSGALCHCPAMGQQAGHPDFFTRLDVDRARALAASMQKTEAEAAPALCAA